MDWQCFDKKLIPPDETTTDNIISEICANKYVYIAVDEMFIPYRKNLKNSILPMIY